MEINIFKLHQVPEITTELTQAIQKAWSNYFSHKGPGDIGRYFDKVTPQSRVPQIFIAMDSKQNFLGTVAIRDRFIETELELGPWLSGLLVLEAYRHQNVATKLIEAATDHAIACGFSYIYVASRKNLPYINLGWVKKIEGVKTFDDEVDIYAKNLIPFFKEDRHEKISNS